MVQPFPNIIKDIADYLRKSAWNFLTGFFGFDWASKVDVGYGIEGNDRHWNNSLAGYDNCDNGNGFRNPGSKAAEAWVSIFIQNATARINSMLEGLNVTWKEVHAMQTMCPYEIVRLIPLLITFLASNVVISKCDRD